MSFYVTLPSNSSMNRFKENKINDYTVSLANPILLNESYEVALTEINYPPIFNVKVGTVKIYNIEIWNTMMDITSLNSIEIDIFIENGSKLQLLSDELNLLINKNLQWLYELNICYNAYYPLDALYLNICHHKLISNILFKQNNKNKFVPCFFYKIEDDKYHFNELETTQFTRFFLNLPEPDNVCRYDKEINKWILTKNVCERFCEFYKLLFVEIEPNKDIKKLLEQNLDEAIIKNELFPNEIQSFKSKYTVDIPKKILDFCNLHEINVKVSANYKNIIHSISISKHIKHNLHILDNDSKIENYKEFCLDEEAELQLKELTTINWNKRHNLPELDKTIHYPGDDDDDFKKVDPKTVIEMKNLKENLAKTRSTNYIVPVFNVTNNNQIMLISSDNNLKIDLKGIIGILFARESKHTVIPNKTYLLPSIIQPINYITVYCDIITEQYYGNSFSKLLKIIPVTSNENSSQIANYVNNLQYVTVRNTVIPTINIRLCDLHGDLIYFTDNFSFVVCTLHFRPKGETNYY